VSILNNKLVVWVRPAQTQCAPPYYGNLVMQQSLYPCDKLSARRHAVTSHTQRESFLL